LPLAWSDAVHARSAGSLFTAKTVDAKRGAGGISAGVVALPVAGPPVADRAGAGAVVAGEGPGAGGATAVAALAFGAGAPLGEVTCALAPPVALPVAVPGAPQCTAPTARRWPQERGRDGGVGAACYRTLIARSR